jgi:hypothetical protein
MVALGCELGITKLDNPHCRFSIQAGRITLSITNIDDLPSDLVDVRMEEVVTPKKDEIEKLLNSGQTVTGAEWKQGDSFIKFLKAKGE